MKVRKLLGLLGIGMLPLLVSAQGSGRETRRTVQMPLTFCRYDGGASPLCGVGDAAGGSDPRQGNAIVIAQGYGNPSSVSPSTGSEGLLRDQGAYETEVAAHLNRYEQQAEDLKMRAQDFPARDRESILRDAHEMETKSREVRGMLKDLDTGIAGKQGETRDRIDNEIRDLDRIYQRTGSASNWGTPFIK